jgi:para-nitrobenzyl esterase
VTARGQRAYLYQFTRTGEDSASRARGAYHSLEITFVFGRPHPLLSVAGSAPYDSTLAEAMSDYWVAFATTGDPNGPPSRGRWPHWPVYDRSTDAYLDLGAEVTPRQALLRAKYDSLDVVARARGEVRP